MKGDMKFSLFPNVSLFLQFIVIKATAISEQVHIRIISHDIVYPHTSLGSPYRMTTIISPNIHVFKLSPRCSLGDI